MESEISSFLFETVRAGHAVSITFADDSNVNRDVVSVPIESRPTVAISIWRRRAGQLSALAPAFYELVIGQARAV